MNFRLFYIIGIIGLITFCPSQYSMKKQEQEFIMNDIRTKFANQFRTRLQIINHFKATLQDKIRTTMLSNKNFTIALISDQLMAWRTDPATFLKAVTTVDNQRNTITTDLYIQHKIKDEGEMICQSLCTFDKNNIIIAPTAITLLNSELYKKFLKNSTFEENVFSIGDSPDTQR